MQLANTEGNERGEFVDLPILKEDDEDSPSPSILVEYLGKFESKSNFWRKLIFGKIENKKNP